MPRCLALAATAAFVALAPLSAAGQTPAPPIVKTEGLRQVSTHVHIIPDNSVPVVPNVGIIVGDKAALVVDTGLGPPNGAAVLAVAQKLAGTRQLYLVTTHAHPEHDLGAQAFPATAKLIRSTDQVKDIAEFGLQLAKIFAVRSSVHASLLEGAEFRKADISFDEAYALDLGGVQAQIMAMGANHTRGDTAVWVTPDKVLFSGDVAMKAQPSFASPYSTVRQWLASLDKLEALEPVLVVPSHGPTGDKAVFITGYRAYLTEVRERAAAEKRAGKSLDQTIDTVTAALAERYPDRARLTGAIKATYAEAP
jgi:glyoxylase-like metal-dependent hydrolase (beta-lactamase superfamily II)